MPRKKLPRFVSGYPSISAFVPEGMARAGEIALPVEGLEAIRLSDFEGLDQAGAAKIMQVSRQTYGRILGEARTIIADALITGKALRVSGGDYELRGRRRHRRGHNRQIILPESEEEKVMPKKNGTGPEGQGPRTGRGAGNCNPDSQKGTTPGRGNGQGGGRGQNSGGRGGGRGGGNRR